MLPTGDVAALVHAQYAACGFNPSNGQYTVLAAFLLESSLPTINSMCGFNKFKVVSLATGSKCLPTARFPPGGDALHDSHAEVLARRGLVRWLHEEVQRALHTASGSEWIEQRLDGKWTLRGGGKLHMYISTVPCGDASMRFLASSQDPAMAALKDSAPPVTLPPGTASRGRNNYSLYGVLRTKPGRADSPPTLCMSCSDKIAAWNVLGVQGALAARIFAPIYMSSVTLGGVPEDMRNMVREDCERAFCQRLQEIKELPVGFLLAQPTLHFTRADFIHSRAVLHGLLLQKSLPSSSNESFCWFADSPVRQEVIINGTRRGVGEKQRGIGKFRPSLCKLQLYRLHEETARMLAIPCGQSGMSYHDAKQSDFAFQAARSALKGPNGPFVGWVVSGKPWESFDVEGNIFYAPMNSEETLPSS